MGLQLRCGGVGRCWRQPSRPRLSWGSRLFVSGSLGIHPELELQMRGRGAFVNVWWPISGFDHLVTRITGSGLWVHEWFMGDPCGWLMIESSLAAGDWL